MSLAEFPSPQRDEERRPSGLDRLPPQDVAAEQCVLGSMLLSKDAIADVVELLMGNDFYRPAHETVHDAIIDLYGRGEPADAVTVSAELSRRNELARIGGASYLHTLIASVPSAANAGYYAEIVHEKATLRRLVGAGTKIVQLGYAGEGDVDSIVDAAQAEIYRVSEKRASEDYMPLSDIMEATLDEIEAASSRGGQLVGVPTGFADLDRVTTGLHSGQLIVVAARPGIGKALALDTPLPTPTGWTTMGEATVGDELIGADGKPTRVVAATDVMTDRPCYEVEFSDGSVIVADAEHQWVTTTRAQRRASSERRPARFHWSRPAIDHIVTAARGAVASADRPTTVPELLNELGPEFAGVTRTIAAGLPHSERPLGRRADGAVTTRLVKFYSRTALLGALALRVARPLGYASAAEHASVVTTDQMAATLRCASADARPNHAVAVAAAFDLREAELAIPPYTLGLWLGDGNSAGARITSGDPEVVDRIRAEGVRVTRGAGLTYGLRLSAEPEVEPRECVVCGRAFVPATAQVRSCGRSCGGSARFVSDPVPAPTCPDCGKPSSGLRRCEECHHDHGTMVALLRRLGVLNNKHIPAAYLRASIAQRRALLAGLLDSDGFASPDASVQFAVTSRVLAEGALELVHSLGYRASLTTKAVKGRSPESSTACIVTFTAAEPVFGLQRKIDRQRLARRPQTRMVTDVRKIESVPVRCVQVAAADHLYLAGRSCIPTHNSTLGLDFARSCSIKHGMTSVIFSLEMGRTEITMRLLAAEAKVSMQHMRQGSMSNEDWSKLAAKMAEVSEAPLFIDDSPNMTMMEIRAKCRRLKQRNNLKLVVVDYLQLMSSGKKVESRQQEVAEFSRSLKLLAKELEVPVVAISQLNRGAEQRTDKKPMLSDLRESGAIEQDADMVILLHRDDQYERESTRPGEADFILAKHRNGPLATITTAFQGHYSRFVDMASG